MPGVKVSRVPRADGQKLLCARNPSIKEGTPPVTFSVPFVLKESADRMHKAAVVTPQETTVSEGRSSTPAGPGLGERERRGEVRGGGGGGERQERGAGRRRRNSLLFSRPSGKIAAGTPEQKKDWGPSASLFPPSSLSCPDLSLICVPWGLSVWLPHVWAGTAPCLGLPFQQGEGGFSHHHSWRRRMAPPAKGPA